MKKRKLLIPGLFLAAVMAFLAPAALADGGQGGGDDGPKRPGWPPHRPASVQTTGIQEQGDEAEQVSSLQALWDYLTGLFS